jgi:hypothetical protein
MEAAKETRNGKEEVKKVTAKETKKEVAKKITKNGKEEKKDLRNGSKAALFLEMVKKAGKEGIRMADAKGAKWNEAGITFYKLSKRLAARGVLTLKDGRIYIK